MKYFFLVFIAIYGGAHLYFYRKLSRAFPVSGRWRLVAVATLILSTVSPLLVRTIERQGYSTLALEVAYPGYLWMAILFLFLIAAACWDLGTALNHLQLLVRSRPRRSNPLMRRRQFQCCLGLALVCAGYGMYEAQAIRSEHVVITTPKLRPGQRLRIVQVSDVHLGILLGEKRLAEIIRVASAARPDILVSTGDLIDGILTHDSSMPRQFQQIKPRLGAFAIPGNHEYYVGFDRAQSMTEAAGFTLLKGQYATVGPIVIAGADDAAAQRTNNFQPLPPHQSTSFTLLLKHQPQISAEVPFDLQLSGHVHKGQIFPFNLVTWLRFPIKCGLTQLTNGQHVYVSRGTGTWGPPVRFLAPPEVTIIDLVARNS
jgi:predicted MPP superfamily phosphohydrolase